MSVKNVNIKNGFVDIKLVRNVKVIDPFGNAVVKKMNMWTCVFLTIK